MDVDAEGVGRFACGKNPLRTISAYALWRGKMRAVAMHPPPDPAAFRPDLLSGRERELLDLAVEGKSDGEIAREMGLSVSTVNSYWVRIRGKVGPLSRTEIVGLVLRHEAGVRHADLLAENARLRASEGVAQADLAQSETDLRASRGGDWRLLALDHVPEAVLVCHPPGHVVYANLQAQRLFAAEPGVLEGLPLWELAVEAHRSSRRAADALLFAPDCPARVVVGIDRPYYARRRDGANFRAVLSAERFDPAAGPMAVVTVREYLDEVAAILGAMRRPYAER